MIYLLITLFIAGCAMTPLQKCQNDVQYYKHVDGTKICEDLIAGEMANRDMNFNQYYNEMPK